MKRTTTFTIVLVGLWLTSWSQPNLHFNYLTVEQGLPSNTVSAIYQDHIGFMWIGTWGEGVSRYDGYSFKTYESIPGNPHTLGNNSVNAIYEDSDYNIWIASWNGISIYHREKETFANYLSSTDNTMNAFWSFLEDSRGRMWIVGKHLYQFQSADSSFQIFRWPVSFKESSRSSSIQDIVEDHNHQLWIVTDYGLYLYHDDTDQVTSYPAPEKLGGKIWTTCLDHLGRFWIGTKTDGIWLFDPTTGSYSSFYQRAKIFGEYNELIMRVFDIIQDANHNLWAITDGSGLLQLDMEQNSIYVYGYDPLLGGGLSDNNLISIYSDRQNNLWVGSYVTGLNISNTEQLYLKRYHHNPSDPNSLSSNLVTDLFEDEQGDLWVATDGGGINWLKLDLHGNVVSNKVIRSSNSLLPIDKTWGLIKDDEGWMWVSTWFGTVKFNPESMEFIHSDKMLLYYDNKDNYWFRGDKGLVQYNSNTGDSTTYRSDLYFARLMEASTGAIWFTDLAQGLRYVDEESGSIITRIPGMMTGICEDENGFFWVATIKDGLIKYEPKTEKVTRFDREKGFLTDNCRGGLLKDDDGYIWIGSNEGIIRFNPVNNEMVNFGLINENLKHFIIPLAQTSDGKIYLGSSKGMIAFAPDEIENPSIPPPPLFTSFQLFDRDLPVGDNSVLQSNILSTDEITLDYKQNVFTIEYASLSYKPSQTVYSYMLEGYDQRWRETSTQRSATYTNLDAGSYQFKVRAGNLNGEWNPEEATLAITILPPPWKTWWAYSLYAIAICCLLLLWRSQLVRRERLKTKLQLEHLELEKVKELDQLKTRFFTNISHEFRTPLTLILGPLKQMYEGSFNGNAREVMAVMMRNSKRLLNLINQLLDFGKLDAGGVTIQASQEDMVQFTCTLFSAFESTAQSRRISYAFQSNQETIPCYFDPDLMEKVIINLLSNAFKFTPEVGSIVVKLNAGVVDPVIDQGAGVVEIRIEDTGQGIETDKIPFVFDRFYQTDQSNTRLQEGTGIGLALAKELVELHHGSIMVESTLGEYTSFIVHLPLGSSHFTSGEIVVRKSYHVTDANLLQPLPENDSNGSGQKYGHEEHSLVLIVEDNQDMQLYLKEILGEQYCLKQADNGYNGLEMALAEIPELIISDVMMPEMDGNELCRRLKADERTSHIPMVLLTARAGEEAKIKGLETGADDYITKPFSPVELRVRVQNLIDTRKKLAAQYHDAQTIHPSMDHISSLDERFVKRVTEIVDQHRSDAGYSVEAFARDIGMSRSQLHRKLKALTGHTATDFIRTYRLKYSRILLEQDYDNIAQTAYECGFKNPSYFTECFKKQFGMLPSEFVKANFE